jgi:hypothetical protein
MQLICVCWRQAETNWKRIFSKNPKRIHKISLFGTSA